MNQVVPPRFLFRWSFQAPRIDHIPQSAGRLLNLPEECRLPALEELEQQKGFAQVWLAWNDQGLGIGMSLAGRSKRPECVIEELAFSDRIEIWIDTRNAQTAHRASKFCHRFALMPAGGGPRKNSPLVRGLPIARSREDAQLPETDKVKIQSEVSSTGYWLEVWLPAESLVGFDPANYPKIGFHYRIHDGELGDQSLAGSAEFPYESDPSLWQTVLLVS